MNEGMNDIENPRSGRSVAPGTASRGRVLVVDDDAAAGEVLHEALGLRGFDVLLASSSAQAIERLAHHPVEVVLTDLRMPGGTGIELAEHLARSQRGLPVIVITAFGSIAMAVEAIRRGAYDFLTKPYDLEVVALALDRAVAHRHLQQELELLRSSKHEPGWGELIGQSPAMEAVYRTIERVGPADSNVLVTGESGTGKELVARALHAASQRAGGPFIAVNCGAVPEPLFESELFGHVRGAFTDARGARSGLFARASGGTLFLDEIGEMPAGMQVKLLRALQERVIRPVGSDQEVKVDVRIVAATNRDLESEVAAGRFRQDLFFRVQVIEIVLPPLRARGNDILLLASAMARATAIRRGRSVPSMPPSFASALLRYDWPGNVRELQNAIERAVALAESDELVIEHLPERIGAAPMTLAPGDRGAELVSLEIMERRHILAVMSAVGGNKKLAAQVLGLDRSTLYRKLEAYGAHQPKRD
jgi:DNA-binding NtrC family response regulator